mmetsp:Transcript_81986/g.235533  ORF Transcript_81986/g.235533 Transcript_81986/m.235533 type:complete len:374 (+) Transcript_81986:77-1198(+)
MRGIDYSKFDSLVAEDEAEERRQEEQRRAEQEERQRRDAEDRRRREVEALSSAEAEWRAKHAPDAVAASERRQDVGRDSAHAAGVVKPSTEGIARSKASAMDFEGMGQEDIENVDVDDFFRPLSPAEKDERASRKKELQERRRRREEDAGRRPLKENGVRTSEELDLRIRKLEEDRLEMAALMERSDRPAVRARLSEFVVELDNDLARLRHDPLELDDEDRQALRLFHLHKMRLPGAARSRRENFADEASSAPRALPADAEGGHLGRECAEQEQAPWEEIATFALDLGDDHAPCVSLDVRIEAVERLPEGAVTCHVERDRFDLRIDHGLTGKRHRLVRTCLQRDIDPERSRDPDTAEPRGVGVGEACCSEMCR